VRGQVAEYGLVFAAVVAVALIVMSWGFDAFWRLGYDAGSVAAGITAGYNYELKTFADGTISGYQSEYNTDTKTVGISLTVAGWNADVVKNAIAHQMSKYGYSVVWK